MFVWDFLDDEKTGKSSHIHAKETRIGDGDSGTATKKLLLQSKIRNTSLNLKNLKHMLMAFRPNSFFSLILEVKLAIHVLFNLKTLSKLFLN